MTVDVGAVRAAAGSALDPEVRCPIADLGLLDAVTVADADVTVHYHLTSPLCPAPFAASIGKDIQRRVRAVAGVKSCRVVIQDHFIGDEIQARLDMDGPRRRVPLARRP